MKPDVRKRMQDLERQYRREGKSERWIAAWKRGFLAADRVAK